MHILAILALRSQGASDPYFRYICNLLRILGSDINYPALSYQTVEGDLDINFGKRGKKEMDKFVEDNKCCNFYHGDIIIYVSGDFNKVSVYCLNHGYMGGENIFNYESSLDFDTN